MRKEIALVAGSTLVAAALGWMIGASMREPAVAVTPPSSLLSAWTFAMFAVPAIAVAAYALAPRDPPRAFFGAFFATFGAGIAIGFFAPLAAFAPGDFAPLVTVDWLATYGRGIAGSASLGALAGSGAYAAAHWRARALPTPIVRPEPEPQSEPEPERRPVVPSREPDPESLAIAKRRLAMGEITKEDFDALVRRLRE